MHDVTARKNRLTYRQIVRLVAHLIDSRTSRYEDHAEVARECTRTLGFPVTASNVESILKAVG